MKNDLLFDFTVDKAAKTVLITREFAAERDYDFSEQNGITKVRITIFNESFERMGKGTCRLPTRIYDDIEKFGKSIGNFITGY